MKILIMGSGGVGGYFGGRLAGAGNEVTFVARGAHLDAMRRDGLTLDSALGNLTVKPARAVADPAEAGTVDVVMFATKLGDTESAARSLGPVVGKDTTVVTFQNGVDGPEIIKGVLPGAHVVAGVARIASHISRPGVIEQRGPFARIEFGEADGSKSGRLEAFHAACKAAGIDAILSNDIQRAVWMKFAMLAPFSGLTTLTGYTAGPIRETPGTRALLEAAVKEVIAVGIAAGVRITADDFANVWKAIEANPPAMTSSMSHDRRAGKPLELDYLSGGVVRLGERHGVPTPTHRFITQALAIDAGGRRKEG
ncbi:MAG: 2-dehydropantoate 2-reductase [Hyphomicrobiaceae bacterium]|nr:2-dehydropantoate 2-reductase [Hyphomicrobiaceae bacterium]